jgi:hypothetical protein
MVALVWGLFIVSLGFVVHVAWWRVRPPHRQTRALLLIFFVLGALVLGSLWIASFDPTAGAFRPVCPADYCQAALLVSSFASAYIITYSAIEADSPTLVLVRTIAAAGAKGLGDAELQTEASDDVLVKPRIADLVRDGLLSVDQQHYQLTKKGRRFVAIFIFYRRLLSVGKGG